MNIGSWWNSNEEIDLVVLGETGVLLAECKWSSKPVGSDILANKWESPPAPLDKGGAEGLAAMPSGADPLDEGGTESPPTTLDKGGEESARPPLIRGEKNPPGHAFFRRSP